jgi:CHAT domain-containing protein
MQDKETKSPLLPRTLNYLALTAEVQNKAEAAEELLRQAQALQKDNPRAFPATHFITLWRLANIQDKRGRGSEARQLLMQAVDVVESARLQTFGADEQRANYFSQFAPAFEQLVAWSVRDGDIETAFSAAARGRGRGLLDQLRMARVDPLESLTGPRGEELRKEESSLKQKISALRVRAQYLTADGATEKEAAQLVAELDATQQRYSDVWREVLNASPVYRALSGQDPAATALATIREKVLEPKTTLLIYHVGREQSYLLLVGDKSVTPQAFPLSVSEALVKSIAPLPQPTLTEALVGKRGLVLKSKNLPEPPPIPEKPISGPTVALGQTSLTTLVDHYREQIVDPDFKATRGLRLKPKNPDEPPPPQRLELLADVLMPPAVRKRLRELGTETLIVVPDGPLHRLPLEALVVQSGLQPRYLLEELPPIAYAPSVAALALLSERSRSAIDTPMSLVTVGDPAYPESKESPTGKDSPAARHVLGLRGQLPRLPFTADESRGIRKFFAEDRVTALEGDKATEKALKAAVNGQRIVHVAAHGIADDRFGNLFGALALTPPTGKDVTDEDGFLSLHEIYGLPLQSCDLAVLSACVTNVGPQRPLESGVTLASGFLAAGARRVVASHWSVDDQSTSELMSAFMEEVTSAAKAGRRLNYAQALHKARLKVRQSAGWDSPYFWAAFVLLGPAD